MSCLSTALMLLENNTSEIDLAAEEIKSAIRNVDLFTGKTTTNDILNQVFQTSVLESKYHV